MPSKIIFLGTAGDLSTASRQPVSSGGFVLQVEDLQFHVDPGPGALNKTKEYGVNLRDSTGVLISHAHLNHCSDLNVIIEAMTLSGLDKRGVLILNKTVAQGDENCSAILTKYHQSLVEKTIILEKLKKAAIDLIEVHALSAEHTDPEAIGFKFFCPRFILSYTSDTKYTKQLTEELQGSDILILNTPYPGNKGKNLNLDTESAIKIIEKVKPRLAVLTHFGQEMVKANPLDEAREIQRKTQIQTIAAKDGFTIVPENYSAKSPQHRLNTFYSSKRN